MANRTAILREYAAALMASRAKDVDHGDLHEAVDAYHGIDVGELTDDEATEVADMIRDAVINVIIPDRS